MGARARAARAETKWAEERVQVHVLGASVVSTRA